MNRASRNVYVIIATIPLQECYRQGFFSNDNEFSITIEVVPPKGNDPSVILGKLRSLKDLPLLSYKHAVFMHEKVDGIAVPGFLRQQIKKAEDPVQEGVDQSRQMLALARALFSGVCVMPPFERFDVLTQIL